MFYIQHKGRGKAAKVVNFTDYVQDFETNMHFATYFWGGILWLTVVKKSEHFLSQSIVFHFDAGSTLNLLLLDPTAQLEADRYFTKR